MPELLTPSDIWARDLPDFVFVKRALSALAEAHFGSRWPANVLKTWMPLLADEWEEADEVDQTSAFNVLDKFHPNAPASVFEMNSNEWLKAKSLISEIGQMRHEAEKMLLHCLMRSELVAYRMEADGTLHAIQAEIWNTDIYQRVFSLGKISTTHASRPKRHSQKSTHQKSEYWVYIGRSELDGRLVATRAMRAELDLALEAAVQEAACSTTSSWASETGQSPPDARLMWSGTAVIKVTEMIREHVADVVDRGARKLSKNELEKIAYGMGVRPGKFRAIWANNVPDDWQERGRPRKKI